MLDTNDDKELVFSEYLFVKFMGDLDAMPTPMFVNVLMTLYDSDHDKTITKSEIRELGRAKLKSKNIVGKAADGFLDGFINEYVM